MAIGGPAFAPHGYSDGTPLAEQWRKIFFAPQPSSRLPRLALTAPTQTLLDQVNRRINRSIEDAIRRQDEVDCNQAVQLKIAALERAGINAATLSVAVVRTPAEISHAVLLVATDQGEMVLDNLNPWILPWQHTHYRWIERQLLGDPDHWVQIASAEQS